MCMIKHKFNILLIIRSNFISIFIMNIYFYVNVYNLLKYYIYLNIFKIVKWFLFLINCNLLDDNDVFLNNSKS